MHVSHTGMIGCLAMFMSLCVDATVMPYAQAVSPTGACGVGVSYAYMSSKSVGDSTPPFIFVLWMCYL